MAKLKRGKWTPEETAQVQGIPKDAKLQKTLIKVAAKLNRPYPNVYQKWYAEYQKGGTVSTTMPNTKDIPVMSLAFDPTYEGKNTNIDQAERISFEKGLAAGIPKLEPFKGAILIPVRLEKIAKEYVAKHHTNMTFSYVTINGNGKQKRMMRKL